MAYPPQPPPGAYPPGTEPIYPQAEEYGENIPVNRGIPQQTHPLIQPPINPGGYPYTAYPPQQPIYPPSQVIPPPPGMQTDYMALRKKRSPVYVNCPYCKNQGISLTTFEMGGRAWILLIVFLFMSWGILCILPCCCDFCKDCKHQCYNCRKVIGVAKPFKC